MPLRRWQDGYPDTWEPEEHVSQDLIALFERQKGLLDASSDTDGGATASSDGASSSSSNSSNVGHASGAAHAAAAAAPATQLQGTAA